MANSNNKMTDHIIRLMQTDDSLDAPQDSIKWARNIFRSRAAEPKASLIQKIVAVLQMDLSPQKPAFGERSAGAMQARQMLFEAGENSIDLRIKEAKGCWDIHGQILGAGFAGGTVELINDEKNYRAELTETSEFKLAGLASGNYALKCRSGETELLVEGLNLTGELN